ncbi:MAG: helix-turn-helix domain-containing protein [Thermoplasmatota archaeon]
MEVKDLLQRVQQYGLDEGEVDLYYHLCRLGPSRAATVAEAAGRKRTDVYRVLDRLVEKGFAEKSLERPARYLPRAIDDALERAMEARRSATEALDAQRSDLARVWPRPLSQADPARPRFTVHQGSSQVNGLLVRMVESAKEEVLLAISRDGLARLDAQALAAALRARAEAGVMVRVLAKRARAGALLPDIEGVRVRYGDLPTFYQSLLVDDREIGLFVAAGKGISGPEETVLWLNSSDVVLAQKALFDQAWMQALSRVELEKEVPRQLQVLRGRWVRGARLRELVQGARSSVVIQAPAPEVAGWAKQGVLEAVGRCAARGVQVLLRLPAGSPAVPGAAVGPQVGDRRNLVAVVDGYQVLLSLGAWEPRDTADPDEEWCLWSTHPDMVAILGPDWWGPGALAALAVRPGRTDPS